MLSEESDVEAPGDEEATVNVKEDIAATIKCDDGVSVAHVELYDSGSTCHLSPYCDDFQNFKNLPAFVFKMVNAQQFDAVGRGDLLVEVPNGLETT